MYVESIFEMPYVKYSVLSPGCGEAKFLVGDVSSAKLGVGRKMLLVSLWKPGTCRLSHLRSA
jgi:hypothetical protein